MLPSLAFPACRILQCEPRLWLWDRPCTGHQVRQGHHDPRFQGKMLPTGAPKVVLLFPYLRLHCGVLTSSYFTLWQAKSAQRLRDRLPFDPKAYGDLTLGLAMFQTARFRCRVSIRSHSDAVLVA